MSFALSGRQTMSTNLTVEGEAVLANAVACGMFATTGQALEEALRLLKRKIEIEQALIAGLNSGDPIPIDAVFWERKKAEMLRRHESGQP
jgi:hypothetical protein